jgi:hypothetical protein
MNKVYTLEHEIHMINEHDDKIENFDCNNARTKKCAKLMTGARTKEPVHHITSIFLQPYLKTKAENHKCRCLGTIPNTPCELKRYVHIIRNTECECIINESHEERIKRVKIEKQWQKEVRGAQLIQCYIETMYIYSPHPYAYITLNELSIIHLNKGFNALCLCSYNELRGKCSETNRDCIALTLQPGLFMRLIQYKSHDFRIAIYAIYNNFHTCKNPPPNQDSVPTLRHLSAISIMAAGTYTLSEPFLTYVNENLPKNLGDELPAYTTINTIVITNYYSVSDNNYMNTCTTRLCQNDSHRQSRLLKNTVEMKETRV